MFCGFHAIVKSTPPQPSPSPPAKGRELSNPQRPASLRANAIPMTAIAPSLDSPSPRDLRDARNDRLFRWFLIATVSFVLVA